MCVSDASGEEKDYFLTSTITSIAISLGLSKQRFMKIG